ncbi:MAG: YeeE/YedE family protein [Planctomycetota bacterium]|jgi:uncharacterized membrane protein YedE/YeeE
MAIVDFTPLPALVGGLLIGSASALAVAMNGKIPGISGVFGRIFRGVSGDTMWRVVFVVGLVLGGALVFSAYPPAAAYRPSRSLVVTAAAGLLVGLGTRVGQGCTSGHGVCGLGRGSVRSLVATLTFMLWAFVTVYIMDHVVGGGR